MTSVYDRIAEARQRLQQARWSADEAAIDADVLARHALGWDRARLVTDGRNPVPAGFDERFTTLLNRRVTREPVAYIVGYREFWGMDIEVTPDVLIPRPETELIVEAACDEMSPRDRVRWIVDVGTGSGCLAIALAREFPAARVAAIDLSSAALAVAARNARTHAAGPSTRLGAGPSTPVATSSSTQLGTGPSTGLGTGRVTLVRANLLDAIAGPVDLIVSNPPYVPSIAQLAPDVGKYEPPLALYGGDDGLAILRRLIGDARARLAAHGLFVVEFGFGQDTQVMELAYSAGWRDVTIREDLQGIPRIAILKSG
jgi:release factor glutamine methyltransferase